MLNKLEKNNNKIDKRSKKKSDIKLNERMRMNRIGHNTTKIFLRVCLIQYLYLTCKVLNEKEKYWKSMKWEKKQI